MDTVSTTNPLPPSGLTNTSVPLGITSSISETPQPINVPVLPTSVFRDSHGIYLQTFKFKDSDAVGAKLYEWDYVFPLTNAYKRTINTTTAQISQFTPWDLILSSLSKEVKMEYALQLIPVKIADSRARVDIVYKFDEQTVPDVYSSKLLANYNSRLMMDDADEQLIIPVPTYWVSNNVATDMTMTQSVTSEAPPFTYTNLNLPSAFIPRTKIKLYVAAKYQHNMMQMDEFSVHVILYPRPTQMLGFTGKRVHTVTRNEGDRTDLITPYFMNFK